MSDFRLKKLIDGRFAKYDIVLVNFHDALVEVQIMDILEEGFVKLVPVQGQEIDKFWWESVTSANVVYLALISGSTEFGSDDI